MNRICFVLLPALFAASALSAGVLVSPTDCQVVQRDAQDLGVIPVEVAQAGGAVSARVRAVPGAGSKRGAATGWTDLVRSGDGFSGQLKASAGGWYTLEAELRDASGAVSETLTVPRVGVGEVFLTYGQSNSCNFGQYRSAAENPLVVSMAPKTRRWQPCRDPQPTIGGFGGTKGSCWPSAGDYLAGKLGLPVGFVACGWGGASVSALAPGAKSHWYENRLRDAIRKLPQRGFRAVLFHQGETDAIHRMRTPVYAGHLKRMIAQSRKDAGWEVPWIVANAAAHRMARQEWEDAVVLAQQQVAAEDPLVWNGPYTDAMEMRDDTDAPDTVPQYRGDNIHFSRAGAKIHGRWWARIILRSLLGVPEYRVELALDADRIGLNRPVAYKIAVFGPDGRRLRVPAELTAMYAAGVKVSDGKLTLTKLPRAGIDYVRLFAKARVPGEKTDPAEKTNALTGYVMSDAVLLKTMPREADR